jgi:hypothetical protein
MKKYLANRRSNRRYQSILKKIRAKRLFRRSRRHFGPVAFAEQRAEQFQKSQEAELNT